MAAFDRIRRPASVESTVRLHRNPQTGIAGFLIILVFWLGTVLSELAGSAQTIATVKIGILWGMILLIPCLATAGASGLSMGRKRRDQPVLKKKKRMPFIASNGLIILVPSAFFLADRAHSGQFDGWFYAIQAIELLAGATNLCLMGLNIRDGVAASGRMKGRQPRSATG